MPLVLFAPYMDDYLVRIRSGILFTNTTRRIHLLKYQYQAILCLSVYRLPFVVLRTSEGVTK